MAKRKEALAQIEKVVDRYRVTDGKNFKLKNYDPEDTASFKSSEKEEAQQILANGIHWLAELQDKLYAQDKHAVLLIFQAMDAAGKDGTIKHVMSGVNPQGCQVYSFKQPTAEELDHDYLWRYMRCMPERGRIGIFNRSYYEEVLVVRVHENILKSQKLPDGLITKNIWKQRLEDIANYEKYLEHNGVTVLKFFLNVSKKEQKHRFLDRLEKPDKNWKFSSNDATERKFWNDYQRAFEDTIKHTATKQAPWYVVPADNKWFTRMVVAAAIVERLEQMDLAYPTLDKAKLAELAAAKKILMRSGEDG
jgi:PPK2 family polyphosphate:nucleotide phosphotransferase